MSFTCLKWALCLSWCLSSLSTLWLLTLETSLRPEALEVVIKTYTDIMGDISANFPVQADMSYTHWVGQRQGQQPSAIFFLSAISAEQLIECLLQLCFDKRRAFCWGWRFTRNSVSPGFKSYCSFKLLVCSFASLHNCLSYLKDT